MTLLLLAACTDGPKPADTADSASIDEHSFIEEEAICGTPEVALSEADGGWSASTEHYTLTISGFDEDEALALASVAELGWGGLARFFGGEVAGPLDVFIAADVAEFEGQLVADGIGEIDGAGGYYDPNTGRAYLYRQPTAYYSRVLLLHELTHQLQYELTGLSGLPTWYGEGLAEALSRHHWDGDCMQLRVRPLLSWEDAAASAAAELASAPPDLADVIAGGAVSRPVAQVLVRLLSSDPELAPRFASWGEDVSSGAVSATDLAAFEAAILPADELLVALDEFVAQDQEPLSPIWLDWIPEGSDRAYGFAEASSAARVKGEVSRLDLTVAWPTAGSVGSVYGYDPDTGEIELALLSADGSLSRFAVVGGAVTWDDYGAVEVSASAAWTQEAGEDSTTFMVGASAVSMPRSLPPAGGLALYGATAHFTGLSWEGGD